MSPVFPSFFFLQQLLRFVTVISENFNILQLEKLYAVISQCIYQHREDCNKTELVKVNWVLSSGTFHHCRVVFGIIVGSFSRESLELEDRRSTLAKQFTSVCQQLFSRRFLGVGAMEGGCFSQSVAPFLPLQAVRHGNTLYCSHAVLDRKCET